MAKKKHFALILALALLAFSFFPAMEADHDCIGQDCPICCFISICENVLKTLALVCVIAAFTAFLCHFAATALTSEKLGGTCASLVSLKVKLSD